MTELGKLSFSGSFGKHCVRGFVGNNNRQDFMDHFFNDTAEISVEIIPTGESERNLEDAKNYPICDDLF